MSIATESAAAIIPAVETAIDWAVADAYNDRDSSLYPVGALSGVILDIQDGATGSVYRIDFGGTSPLFTVNDSIFAALRWAAEFTGCDVLKIERLYDNGWSDVTPTDSMQVLWGRPAPSF